MKSPITAILIGAGQRGADSYAPYALRHPDELRFVAVAEPIAERRERFARQHGIPAEFQFTDWKELLARPALAQAALVCTQDWQHTGPALAALRGGYDVLLEKPMAVTEADCRELVRTAEETGRQLHICHVLRYTRHMLAMREIVQSGELGQIVHVDHRENVSWWHASHSYVRGNWRNSAESSPMILAKCCHDLDALPWVLGQPLSLVGSTGGLMHYRPENAPAGAPARCTDGCPAADTCPYHAPFIYMTLAPFWRSFSETSGGFPAWITRQQLHRPGLVRALAALAAPVRRVSQYRGWPLTVLTENPTPENVMEALRAGPYGRCVYHCDNDVVDHQVVLMRAASGASVSLTMHSHSDIEHRSTRIHGSRAELSGVLGNGGARLTVVEHRTGKRRIIDTSAAAGEGHGGGDFALMASFVRCLRGEENARSSAQEALASHLLAFAAEEARRLSNIN